MYISSFHFYYRLLFCNGDYLFTHSPGGRYLDCFQFGEYYEKKLTIKICVKVLMWTCAFISLEYLGVGLLSHIVSICLTL